MVLYKDPNDGCVPPVGRVMQGCQALKESMTRNKPYRHMNLFVLHVDKMSPSKSFDDRCGVSPLHCGEKSLAVLPLFLRAANRTHDVKGVS